LQNAVTGEKNNVEPVKQKQKVSMTGMNATAREGENALLATSERCSLDAKAGKQIERL
jgi:hypothetical protein